MKTRLLGAAGLVLALSAACGSSSAARSYASGLDVSSCVQETAPGEGFPAIPVGHHAQASPRDALDDYLTVQAPGAPHLDSQGWQETSAQFGHHAFVHVVRGRADAIVRVLPASGGGWWVGDVGAC
jgi:hypothetical protein